MSKAELARRLLARASRKTDFIEEGGIADYVSDDAELDREAAAALEGDAQPVAQCDRCQGNGEIVTNWDEYLKPPADAPADHATETCPDCDGTGIATPSPKLGVAVEALEKIACRHVTIAPLWWQVVAREALSQLEKPGE